MLQIDDVSGACLKFVEVSINFDTVFTILSLADLYLCKELQNGAKFFNLQNLDEITMSEEFQQLKLIELLLDVKKINQDSLYKAYVEWTKYELVNRSAHFPDLFAKINLNFVSNKLLDDVISKEKLVIENCHCSKILRKEMTRCVRKKDKIYVTGGVDANGLHLSCGECCNPTSNAWTKISAMKLARSTHALAACKGHVYAIGGRSKDDNGSRLVSVERYNPESDSWDEITPMKFFRSWLAAVPKDDNYIYALGGESRDDKIEKSVERYDVIPGECSNVSTIQESRHCHAASVVQGKIYTVGGWVE